MSYIKIVIVIIIRMIRVLIRARMVVLVKFYSILTLASINFIILIMI